MSRFAFAALSVALLSGCGAAFQPPPREADPAVLRFSPRPKDSP